MVCVCVCIIYITHLKAQLQDLKESQTTESSNLHSMLVDPAVNMVFQRMRTELKDSREKLEQAQNDLSAWKFTPDRFDENVLLL